MLAVLGAICLFAGAASASAPRSGLHGYVEKGPITPVCQAAEPCNGPAAGAVLAFARAGGAKVRVRTSATGFYRIKLRAGYYAVRSDSDFDRTPFPAKVHVRPGRDDRLDFFIDTGIQ